METNYKQGNVMTRQQWLDFAKKLRQKEAKEIQEAVIEVSAPIWREANEIETEPDNTSKPKP